MKHKINQYFSEYSVSGISVDSRKVNKGDAFFAFKGIAFDSNNYIDQALAKGASVIFTDNPGSQAERIIYLDNIRLGLAIAAGILYPKLPNNLIAVTGTNGKTSVASYVQQIIEKLGMKSASIGTIGVTASGMSNSKLAKQFDSSLTTPDPVTFRQIMDFLVKKDIQNVVFEASSHGLDQDRLGEIKVKAAAFTSFSQDHLDYHQTMENYLQAKLLLFSKHLDSHGEAVINSETDELNVITAFLREKRIKFSTVGRQGDLKILQNKQSLLGQEIICRFNQKEYKFHTGIIGSFQAGNLLIAAKLVNILGYPADGIIPVLPQVEAVPGRLQRVTSNQNDWHVFVDYAHTPDALRKALQELKVIKNPSSKLVVVFGCGGNRDNFKRPVMGRIATEFADAIIVTDDNPRLEDPANIRKEIMAGIKGKKVNEIGSRQEAINNAVANLKKDDILLIAGKGHEDYQIIGDKKIHFSDYEVALSAINSQL